MVYFLEMVAYQRGQVMRISISDAKGQLTELVRRAEAGDDVVLTRHGRAAARLVAVQRTPDAAERRALMEELRSIGTRKATSGPDAARSQDDLYDEDGMPR